MMRMMRMMMVMTMMMVVRRNLRQRGADREQSGDGYGEQILGHHIS
ncbi:MAG: hypothetical protein WDN69_35665 [Aliidongia sp.]